MTTVSGKVARNIIFILAGRIAGLAMNMVTVVFLARYLGEETFGVFSYSLVFSGFFALLSDFGMKPILVREISRNRSHAATIIGNALVLKIIFSAVAIILASIAAILFFSDGEIRISIFILSFTILFSSKLNTVRIVFESIFHADLQMKYPVFFEFLDSFFLLSFILILGILKANYLHFLFAYVIANLPGLIITLFLSFRRLRPRITLAKREIVWLLKESFPLFLYLLLAMLINRVDVLFIKYLWGERMVGIYAAAFRLTVPLSFIPIAVTTAFYPIMSLSGLKRDIPLSMTFQLSSKLLLVFGFLAGAFGLLFGEAVFTYLYGDQFIEAVLPFQLLLWSQTFVFVSYFLVDFNNSQDQQRRNTLSMTLMVFVSFLFNWILIFRYGIVGAGVAKLLLHIIGFFILYLFSYRIIPSRSLGIFIKSLGFLVVFLIIVYSSYQGYLNFSTKILSTGLLIFILIIYLFSKEERIILKKSLHSIRSRSVIAE